MSFGRSAYREIGLNLYEAESGDAFIGLRATCTRVLLGAFTRASGRAVERTVAFPTSDVGVHPIVGLPGVIANSAP
jgi:hypothetical protein